MHHWETETQFHDLCARRNLDRNRLPRYQALSVLHVDTDFKTLGDWSAHAARSSINLILSIFHSVCPRCPEPYSTPTHCKSSLSPADPRSPSQVHLPVPTVPRVSHRMRGNPRLDLRS